MEDRTDFVWNGIYRCMSAESYMSPLPEAREDIEGAPSGGQKPFSQVPEDCCVGASTYHLQSFCFSSSQSPHCHPGPSQWACSFARRGVWIWQMLIYTECAGSPHSWFSLTNHSILLLVFVVLGLNRTLAHARKELHQLSHTPSFFFLYIYTF